MHDTGSNDAKGNPISAYWLNKRLELAVSMIPNSAKKLLDVGCGEGYLIEMLQNKYPKLKASGLDSSKANIEIARKKNPNAAFIMGSAELLPFDNASFDVVMYLEILDHLENPVSVLKEAKRALTKMGICIISIPNYNNILWNLVWAIWTNTMGKKWHGAHCTTLERKEMEEILNNSGFKIEEIQYTNLGLTMMIKCRRMRT